MKQTLSVVISAYNEEKKLESCLRSVKKIADEIIVVDNTSIDATASIAKKFTKNVFVQPNHLMLNINKNYGFSKATTDWILNLDADEEITEDLSEEIKTILSGHSAQNGYWISRKNMIFGKWIANGLWWPDKQLRLFKKKEGKFPCVHIHEYIEVHGTTGELKNPYIHHNYESISQYLTKLERCTTSESLSLIETGYTCSWYDAIRFPFSDFLKTFFAQKGYKDGLHGLVLSMFQAFYSFVVFAKVWEQKKFLSYDISSEMFALEQKAREKEMQYWILSSQIQETSSPFVRILKKIQRKLWS